MERTASPFLIAAATLGLLSACGSNTQMVGPGGYVCTPACPAGQRCTAAGCALEADLAVPDATVGDDGGSDACGGLCGGDVSYCLGGRCVPCLLDAHCPAGSVCRPFGGVNACLPGCVDDSHCDAASHCCGGACTDTRADSSNCGACGQACSVPHAGVSCVASQCVAGNCDPGWADCNHSGMDGCETNVHTDVANCGACGTTCTYANGVSGCADGCYLAGCVFGFDDCNANALDGCETSTLADKRNCGGCGALCSNKPHAAVDCINANCQLTACDKGWSDCDGLPDNGCETNTGVDVNNCGLCGNACGNQLVCINGGCTCKACNIPNAKTKCVNLKCVFDQCLPGFGDCNFDLKDGCETTIDSDAKNCGACGHVCPGNQICVMSACVDAPPALAVWHLDENAGMSFADATGHGHAGTTNGTTWAPGIAGSALSFALAGQAQMKGNYVFSVTNEMTAEGWIYMRQNTGKYQGIVSGNGCCNYRLMVSPTMNPYFNPGERRDRPVKGFTFDINTWYHVAMTIGGGTVNIYVNGALVDTEQRDSGVGLPDQNDVFQIGAGEAPGMYVPDGIVDEVAIYDRALDQATVQNHYNNPGKF